MQIISNRKWNALQLQLKAIQQSNMAASFNNFTTQIFPHWSVIREIDSYQTIDDIYSVVKKLATASALVDFYGYDKKGGEDLPDSDKLTQFLTTLDFEQKEIMYTYLYLFGEVFAYKNRIDVGLNAGLSSLSFLHPSRMVIALSTGFPTEIVGYKYQDTTNGIEFPIALEDIMFIKLVNPSISRSEEWRGLSPIKVLAKRLTRIQAGEDASVAQMQNGGVPGIVYDKTPNLASDVIGARRDNFGRFLRNSDNKGAPYFSANELGYIALGTPLADMDVAGLQNIDFDKICNAYGVSSVLFNNKQASTESNVKEMKKEMYTNTILPNIYRVESAFNKSVVPEIKTKGVIKCDTSEIPELQLDMAKAAVALSSMYWLTGNEKREAMMYDQDSDPLMDKYIIPSGMMLLDDLDMSAVQPIPNVANDYAAPVVALNNQNGQARANNQ
jgi:HK97 family phage portal protein